MLLLRADAGGPIGSGHVMRALALGEAWIELGGQCLLASHDIPPALGVRVRAAAGFQLAAIASPPWSLADARETLGIASRAGARAAAVDTYFADAPYLAALEAGGLRTLFVDDVARLSHYPCSLLLNQNLSAAPELYAGKAEGAALMLGPGYAMLRREFAAQRRQVRAIGASARRLLATFGGVDPKNASAVALEALALTPEIEAELVIGAANPNADALAARAEGLANVVCTRDARDMAQRIAAHEMILCGAGTTVWEAAALGAPMMLVASAPEEEAAALRITRAGGVYLGRAEDLTAPLLAAAIREFAADLAGRARSSVVGRNLVDGLGAQRVAAALRRLID